MGELNYLFLKSMVVLSVVLAKSVKIYDVECTASRNIQGSLMEVASTPVQCGFV